MRGDRGDRFLWYCDAEYLLSREAVNDSRSWLPAFHWDTRFELPNPSGITMAPGRRPSIARSEQIFYRIRNIGAVLSRPR